MSEPVKSWIGDWSLRPEFDTVEKRWVEMWSIFNLVSRSINPWKYDDATNARRTKAMQEEFKRRSYKVT